MPKPPPDKPKSPPPGSPAATMPMFRDEVDDAAAKDVAPPPGRAWAATPAVPVMPTPLPTFGKNQLRPPARITEPPTARDDNDPIVQLARMTGAALAPPVSALVSAPMPPGDGARALGRPTKPAPRVTQAGPVVRAPPERVELVTQIGSVTKTEKVLRSEAERRSEPSLRALAPLPRTPAPTQAPAPRVAQTPPPAERPSEPRAPQAAERPSEPRVAQAERPSEPRAPQATERPSEPRVAQAERPSEPRIPHTPRPAAGARAVAVESPDAPLAWGAQPAEPPPAPAAQDAPLGDIVKSWSGRAIVPDLGKAGPGFGPKPARAAAAPVPGAPGAPRHRSAGESLARLFYFAAGGMLVAAVAIYGGRFWRDSHPSAEPPPLTPPQPVPSAALASAGGRVELSPDRHGVSRIAGGQQRWGAPLPGALDALALTGPIVIGHMADTIVALDLETGRTRFTWAPPAGGRWAPQPPAAINDCLIAVTTHDKKTTARCLELATGQQRWAAQLNGDHDCMQAPAGVPGAVIMACSGWTAVIDDRTGAATPITGGVGLVGDQTLLRAAGGKLVTLPWSDAKRRFTQSGDVSYSAASVPVASAVLHADRLVLRAVDTSDELAVIAPREGAQLRVTAPAYRLADATPLTRRCGGETSPRLQLLELTPRVGASFDPATAGERALALLDVEAGNLAWTSRKTTGLHGARAAAAPVCRGGHYLVPLDVVDSAGKPASVMWIVDAETGKTTAVLAFDAELGAAMADLAADQIDDDRLVGVGRKGVFELTWRKPGAGVHDARRELEAVLGPLP
ncbi:MAG TPA: PQQ-binding-like beta-propeller repeat protein [Kofleriaceae bacterium]